MKYAFVDEFGAFGFNFENPSCSSHFIISAIVVDEPDLQVVIEGVEAIRQKYFQQGEMKSSKVGKNHKRRCIILNELKKLPFHIFTFVCDKTKIFENSGLRYKQPFYKFLNNLVYKELRLAYSNLVITADEVGTNEYLKSFAAYIRAREVKVSLFDKSLFRFEDSKSSVIIQLADIVSGSLAYNFDEKKKADAEHPDYVSILKDRILRIKIFPETFETYKVPTKDLHSEYNPEIAEVCYRKARSFIEDHYDTTVVEEKEQVAVLNYLLFRFMNRSPRNYIPTKELINQLVFLGYEKMTIQAFRNKIIAKLRDHEVIISSSPKGYKIPSTETELCDFIDHGISIIMPMLTRIKKCHSIIRMGTHNKIDLLNRPEYEPLAKMLENDESLV